MSRKLLILLLPAAFTSCITLSTVNIQVLEPASNPLDPDCTHIAFVNSLIIDNPDTNRLNSNENMEYFLLDTYNKTTTDILFHLAEILEESPINFVTGYDKMVEIPMSKPALVVDKLDTADVASLSEELKADCIIGLDGFWIEFNDTLISHPGELRTGWEGYFSARLDMAIYALLRTYSASRGIVVDEFELEDTLTWHEAAYRLDELEHMLPDSALAMEEAAYFTAISYARRIAPYWREVERFYYDRGNRRLRRASVHLNNNNFIQARRIYEDLLDSRHETLITAAYFNLALICEIEGATRDALVWARKAIELNRQPVIEEYIEILEARLEKSRILDYQFGTR